MVNRPTLHYNTVTPLLKSTLLKLMQEYIFMPFRLVGGTSLSLRLGHRKSVDIDLFTNAPYGSLDFSRIEDYLQNNFQYFSMPDKTDIIGFGKSYFIGNSQIDFVKLDLYYYDEMNTEYEIIDGIRMAKLEDIVAMKIDVISRSGRKKDFWDLHELLGKFSLNEMIELHKKQFEYTHNRNEILDNLTNFNFADDDFDPICLRGKIWELIKLDIFEDVTLIKQSQV
ncbi:MAG: nucleotidyl transferase AbiEii/AbiGii toxin family protein [Porphyromonadaceae bacterium]|nr:nucleotidyl transferase AbiEii/AbiGii toxin family protein [Porphyromonadaceae bacterium]